MSLIAIIGQFDVHPEDVAKVGDLMRTIMIETQKEQLHSLRIFDRPGDSHPFPIE